jgi:hypothetical protein
LEPDQLEAISSFILGTLPAVIALMSRAFSLSFLLPVLLHVIHVVILLSFPPVVFQIFVLLYCTLLALDQAGEDEFLYESLHDEGRVRKPSGFELSVGSVSRGMAFRNYASQGANTLSMCPIVIIFYLFDKSQNRLLMRCESNRNDSSLPFFQ